MLDKLSLRLCIRHQFLYFIPKRRIFSSPTLQKRIANYKHLVCNEELKLPTDAEVTREEELLNSLKDKLIYNSVVTAKNAALRWRIRQAELRRAEAKLTEKPPPLSLKWIYDEKDTLPDEAERLEAENNEEDEIDENIDAKFPYNIVKQIEIQSDTSPAPGSENRPTKFEPESDVQMPQNAKRWWHDYEVYEDDLIDEERMQLPDIDYGTPNPNILPSNIPCGGCGANLHCRDSSIPGYLPSELFSKCSETDLRKTICQRCTFLKNYNVALSINVDPSCYPKLLEKLKAKDVLIVLLVDMTDYPCSIWPKLWDIVGREKPIVLVGNKIDLIPGDSRGWLENAERVLRESFPTHANVVHTELISAKTDYGIESLISNLHSIWNRKGDVYLVGCTNVGKSSLFNKLIQSDFCQARAMDIIQRATTAPWPGTTLNLLKFPMIKLDGWKTYLRQRRLTEEHIMLRKEQYLAKLQAMDGRTQLPSLPDISGAIGRTFTRQQTYEVSDDWMKNSFEMPTFSNRILRDDKNEKTLDANDPEFKSAKWCYDTPGVVHPDQIIHLLTMEELDKMIPKKTIEPRIFSVYPEQSIFIGGLARIDLIHSDMKFIRLIIYASTHLPVTLCQTAYCDEIYRMLLGTKYFAVPCGSPARLERWPQLKSTEDFEFVGQGSSNNIADIVLSSVGWVSPVTDSGATCIIRPFTPEGRGIHLRKKPLLQFTPLQRRGRIHNTPTYKMSHHIEK